MFPSSLDSAMDLIGRGSTAVIKRHQSNVVIKRAYQPSGQDSINYLEIERQILDVLRSRPRIIKFLGTSQKPEGLSFTEANCSDLQHYLDSHNKLISEDLRLEWRLQAAEAIAYLHSKNVIHSDLRPDNNYLLHVYNDNESPELLLCNLGDSYCKTSDRIVDEGHLPDAGFFNHNKK